MSGKRNDKPLELDFITYDGRPTNNDPTLRSRVRSHVTRLQHRNTRERVASSSRREEPFQPEAGSGAHGLHEPGSEHAEAAGAVRPESRTSQRSCRSEASISVSSATSRVQIARTRTAKRRIAGADVQQQRTDAAPPVSAEQLVRTSRVASNVSRQTALGDPGDEMARILAHLKLDFATVMEHYRWIVWVQSSNFERIFMPKLPRGAGYEELTSKIARDPALVGTAVLVATGHILSIRDTTMSQSVARCIFALKSFVLKVVNEALRDPARATSDPLVCAVLILASHEGLQGSTEYFHVHMRGLVQMINLRGGLSRLNESQKFLEEYIIWQDTNVCAIMGCEPYWKQTENQTPGLPSVSPYPAMWLLKEV